MGSERDGDVVVVGAGPAGLACAIVLAENGWDVALCEREVPGGLLANMARIKQCPIVATDCTGSDIASRLLERALELDIAIEFAGVEAIEEAGGSWVVHIGERAVRPHAVVVCSGRNHGMLGIAGEAELYGRGISKCAACDGPLFRGGVVAVVGSGDWGIEEALTVAEFAERVVFVTDRRVKTSRGQERALSGAANIEVVDDAVVCEIGASPEGALGWVMLKGTKAEKRLELSGLIVAQENGPALDFLGCLDSTAGLREAVRHEFADNGLFFAGDVTSSCESGGLLSALSEGNRVGHVCSEYLSSRYCNT